MADKSWKAFERRLARRVGGRRIPVTGERDGADVIAGPFVYQAKLRRGLPSYLQDWLRGITAAGRAHGRNGIVVWKAPRARDDDAVVVLRLLDWQKLHGPDKEKPALPTRALGRESGRVVQGTQTNASATSYTGSAALVRAG